MAKGVPGPFSLITKPCLFLSILLLSSSIMLVSFFHTFFGACQEPLQHLALDLEPDHPNGLEFMSSKRVVLVSHELSLTGGPLLLMELAVLLRNAGGEVKWLTNRKDTDSNSITLNLEAKLLEKGVQILPARDSETVRAVREADLVILNTAVAGKWLDSAFKEDISEILPKILWWIHEMRGHYFTLEFVKHLPKVGGSMIDSYATADYWRNRTQERLRIAMPPTYVVHLGNSKELTEASEDNLARRLLRGHIREVLGLHEDEVLFGIINSVSRGKGQDLFLKSFYEAVQMVKGNSRKQPEGLHAVVVGSDMSALKYEIELRDFVKKNHIEHLVHFINKTMNVVPYLTAIDVLVQNSQGRGECFGRITIEAMAFQLPILGTAAGGTKEIVVNGSTGLLHPVGKVGVPLLARNIVELFSHKEIRMEMGKKGYKRVREQFMERHMAQRIGKVFQDILDKVEQHKHVP